MPPKKRKLVAGQLTLFGVAADRSCEDRASSSTPRRRGEIGSWRELATPSNKAKYPWIDVQSDGIYCLYCKGEGSGASRSGSETFIFEPFLGKRPDLLRQHEQRSLLHQRKVAEMREAAICEAKKMRLQDTIDESLCITADGEAFCDALRVLYFLAKREMAHTTNFLPLRQLCIQLGNQSLPRLEQVKNATYASEQSMQEMLRAIGYTLEEDLLGKVAQSPYYAIILDECTDISVTKELALSVVYLDLDTGKTATHFLKLVDLTKAVHATGQAVANAVSEYLEQEAPVSQAMHKLAGVSCDGASVMLGERNGVVAHLKMKAPQLIVTHCAAHRLSLASCNAAASTPWFKRFESLLSSCYSFFSRSTVRSAELSEVQKVLDIPQLKLQRPTETRWLSLENSVHALRRCLSAVRTVTEHEGSEGDATAIGLATQLQSPKFIATLYFMSDVLSTLGKLSTAFQKRGLNLLAVEGILRDHLSVLEKLQADPFSGGHMLCLENDHPGTTEKVKTEQFVGAVQSYLTALITNIKSRFPKPHLLSLLASIDPRNACSTAPAQMLELATHFDLDGPQLMCEFQAYQSFVSSTKSDSMRGVVASFWQPSCRETMAAAYPLLSDIIARVAVLPASSAEVERVFSNVKRVKTPIRNRLKVPTVDSLVRISMYGPPTSDWDPLPAAEKWKSWGNRRLRLQTRCTAISPAALSTEGLSDESDD